MIIRESIKKGLILLLLLFSHWVVAQKYHATTGSIKFYAEDFFEDITAENVQIESVIDVETGQIIVSIPIIGFKFRKSLMQKHFNKKYLDSEKYPTSTFKGHVSSFTINQQNLKVTAEGELEIHGVIQPIIVSGSLNFVDDRLILHSVFLVKLVDYNIKIPELMFRKIAEQLEVTVDIEYVLDH
jgi:polyisoprenoid-binding protein YceI